jgi:D-alanine-D-alanine ligase and related ATP-grasp enzymes
MSHAHKIRVAVLRGGPSSEYDISLSTGDAVLKNLPSRYEGVDVFISQDGIWHVHGIERSPAQALKHVDVAFLALHGQFGEDGKVQTILEHLGIPYTGSQAFPSALAMHKHHAKEAVKKLGHALAGTVKLAWHKIFTRDEIRERGIHIIFREIPHPSIVKPVAAGSSVGVSIVRSFHDLESALEAAFAHGDSVMIEELIEGREATCGVVDGFRGQNRYALLPVEIIPHKKSPFFDYAAKYHGQATEICPGSFDDVTKQAIQNAAVAVHESLGLRHYSRSDFIVHPKRGVFFLETNTLPGLTAESLFPKSIAAVGSTLPDFLDHIIGLALSR